MGQSFKRWSQRGILTLAMLFLAVYVGDTALFSLRGSPQGKIMVNPNVPVPLKSNQPELRSPGFSAVSCARSLFPQARENPCWLVRRSAN